MNNFDDSTLAGKCLIAMPWMEDERFENALIYICSHNKNGAIGFVFNQKLKEFSFSDLAYSLPIDHQKITNFIDLYQGGPVEKIRGFILHSPEYVRDDTILIKDKFAVSSSIDTLTDIAFGIGPKDTLVALGYAAWGPNQLEKEIIGNSWLVTDASPDLVFHTKDEEKWQRAIDESGIDISRIITATGNA